MEFWFILAIITLIFYGISRFTNGPFKRFILFSPLRRRTWEWVKRLFFVVATSMLLVGTFQRWWFFHDEIECSVNPSQLNLAYSNQIEVEVYLMSQHNVLNLFEGKSPDPDRQTILKSSNLCDKPTPNPLDPRFYLVIRLKNKGDQIAWGLLDYFVEGRRTRGIDVSSLPSHMQGFTNIVLKASHIDKNLPGSYPHLEVKWKQLFTTRAEKP